jgi:hypothetical protein
MGVKGPLLWCIALVIFLVACAPESISDSRLPEDEAASDLGLSEAQAATLASLEQVDDFPLYTMHHYAPEALVAHGSEPRPLLASIDAFDAPWGCALFAALADPESRIFGRNFDWEFSPALLLFNHPPDRYVSVSMVDIAYLGYPGEDSADLTRRPLGDLLGLLDSSRLPFDGMNEAGLVIGMAAVPTAYVPADPEKDTVDSLGIIRLALDGAATVEEAVDLIRSHNVDFEGQTPLHYLLADATGDAALVEYHAGEIRVLRTQTDWHQATNFLLSAVDSPAGQCERYDAITAELESNGGDLGFDTAMSVLERVAQPHTQWSLVYGITSGDIHVVMGQVYERVHTFSLEMRD